MALTQLAPPYPIFTDKSGDPLDNGYLYFGEVNKNPETNPIQVYYDSAFTQPAAQPLRTSNGYVMRNGSPALIYADVNFSVTIRDKNNALVIYSPVGYGINPAAAVTGSVTVQDQTGDGTTVTFGMGASPNTINATNVYIDGVYQEKDTYTISGSNITFSEAPPLNAGIEIVSQESPLIGGASASQISYNEGSVGAVNTTVKAKLQETVSVKDFGAVGDGVTDDTAAIQAALNVGGTIYFPSGTYLSQKIDVGSNTHLVLNTDATIKSLAGFMTTGNGSMLIDIANDASNVSITGGTIDGNLSASDLSAWPNSAGNSTSPFSTVPYLIWVRSVDNITFDNVRFVNTITSALRFFGEFSTANENTDVRVMNCYFDNILGNCIDGSANRLIVTNNTVNLIGDIRGTSSGGTKGGLIVVNAKYGIVSNNIIRQTTDSSIYITGDPGGDVSISGNNILYSGKDAIKALNSSSNCVIDGNIVVAAGKTCIGVFDDGVSDKGHSIMSNNVIGYINTPTDILDPLNSYASKTITGCTNQSSLWFSSGGIDYVNSAIGANASNLVIIGNKVSNTLGVVINPTEQDILISSNLISDATGSAVKVQGGDVKIDNNIISNVGSNASFSPNGEIMGINIDGVNNRVTVSNNKISGTGSDAIFCDEETDWVTITANNISDWNGTAGIYLNGAVSVGTNQKIIVSDNICQGTDNTIRGLYLRSIDDLVISGNIVDECSDGIRVDASGDVILSSNRVTNCVADGIRVSGSTVSSAVIGNTVDTANRGVVTDITTANVTAYGNIGTNCTTSTMAISGTLVKPATVADHNI